MHSTIIFRAAMQAACLAALLCAPARAADDGSDPSVTVLEDLQSFVVQSDGSYVETGEYRVRLNEQRAVAGEAQRQFHFNATLEDVEILEAYTEKPDGRRIAVAPEQIKLQQEPAYSGAPMFQDMRIKTLIYGDVALGDKLYSKVRRSRRTAMFAGQFSDVTYPHFRPTDKVTLIYDLPSSMPLNAEADGFKAGAPVKRGGRTVYRWDYVPADNPRLETETVSYGDFGRRLIVSTFPDYRTLGLAYDRAAAPAAATGKRVETLARELVQGLSDPRAKALAIDNWVRRNIRYVAVYIGNGGVVPHGADAVLESRYGDCKDHTTLMEAMLRAVGIESTPALINAGNAFKLARVASLGDFNHVITYIPSLDLFLDSTAENIGAGYLPAWDLDKQVILTRSGALARTPTTQPGKIKSDYTVRIGADGAASFEFTRAQLGSLMEPVRWEHRNWKKTDQAIFVEQLLKSFGIEGKGEVRLGDLSEASLDDAYRFTLRGTAKNWLYLPGTVGSVANSSLYIGLAGPVFGLTAEAKRTQPYLCPVNDTEERATYEFPAGAKVLAVPRDVHIASPYFQYDARFQRGAAKLLVTRTYRSGKEGSRVCTPADFDAMQADIKTMVRDLRGQFILAMPDSTPASLALDGGQTQ